MNVRILLLEKWPKCQNLFKKKSQFQCLLSQANWTIITKVKYRQYHICQITDLYSGTSTSTLMTMYGHFFFRSSPVHIFGNSNSLHSYARPPLASSAPNPSRGHLRERRRVRVTSLLTPTTAHLWIYPVLLTQCSPKGNSCWQFILLFIIHNRPAVNLSLEFSQCPRHFLMMKTWPGLTPGPPQPGIASLKVRTLSCSYCLHRHLELP